MSDVQSRLVGVVVERQPVENAWIDHRWRVTGLLPGAAAVPDWTCLEERDGMRRYYAGAAELLLFPMETETLKYNIEGEAPAILRVPAAAWERDDAGRGDGVRGGGACARGYGGRFG